ncbi:unnamed protein product, partial [Schistosoma curassoni]|uniref:C2H2-type domain-containing protein n=1 Tax=Schistosoma curassoni TaxID=6186 RepID=A0A183JI52_9TREM
PWKACAPLVWNQGFPTPLDESSVPNNPVKAQDICFPFSHFCKQHHNGEKTSEPSPTSVVPGHLEANGKYCLLSDTDNHYTVCTYFNDVPTNSLPFGSNKSPPLLLSAQSTSTLVPVAISPGQLHSTNPFLFNTHPQLSITSKDFMSNQRVSANSTSTSPQVQSNFLTVLADLLHINNNDNDIQLIAIKLHVCINSLDNITL